MLKSGTFQAIFLIFITALSKEIKNYVAIKDSYNRTLNFPLLGFGTAGMQDDTSRCVTAALIIGLRMFDTAQAKEWYNEAGVGSAVKTWSKKQTVKPIIVTKIHPRDFQKDRMIKALDLSRKNMMINSTTPLDVVLLHTPVCWPGMCTKAEEAVTWQTGWRNLETLYQRGYCRFIGVSNFGVELLEELLSIATERVSFLQNFMDPFHQDKDTRLFAKRRGIVYMAYSSLGLQWFGRLNRNPVLESDVLQSIAKTYSKSVGQIVYSWVLQSGVAALPRTANPAHLAELRVFLRSQNRSRLTVFLKTEDMNTISKLDGSLDTPS